MLENGTPRFELEVAVAWLTKASKRYAELVEGNRNDLSVQQFADENWPKVQAAFMEVEQATGNTWKRGSYEVAPVQVTQQLPHGSGQPNCAPYYLPTPITPDFDNWKTLQSLTATLKAHTQQHV